MQNNIFSSDSTAQNILVLDKTDSTNTYLKNYLSKFKPLEEFTAIMTHEQTAGRGLRGNIWQSAAGENLTFSLLLYPDFLPIHKQFLLSACISLSVYELLLPITATVRIKWPNDIYVSEKKIAGILIENSLQHQQLKHSIVGIGMNINQTHFVESIQSKATSLKLATHADENYSVLNICQALIGIIRKNYNRLKNDAEGILHDYNAFLFQKDQLCSYQVGNEILEGKIIQVEEDGFLQVLVNNEIKKYDLKDISYLK
ncbi:biotin--[acetyl-CoA-carboxylase] ligase [Sphingobacterium hungaricum]|uniref:biotin--[acetyl-CoA-carboxylase] ligase n=1 Tax=Sphingobacterium hungaricum TaxID=2082723 RepID=UPI0018C98027|nr:biotin--[acetyl-CoA-carboxylase] ligase [Sphingobacterium hungaricum]